MRELENLLERALIFSEGETIVVSDLVLPQDKNSILPAPATLQSLERRAIETALLRWEGNRTKAAEELGITRRTLLNKIKSFGIDL